MKALEISLIEKHTSTHIETCEDREHDLRLTAIEEMRELTRGRILLDQEERILHAAIQRYAAPELGDLVLTKRFQVDKSLGMKLHAKWDGPYKLNRISKSGISGNLEDLKTGKIGIVKSICA